jgi:hypothetical protein
MGGLYPPPGATPAQAFVAKTFAHVSVDEWRQITYHLAGISHWDPQEGLQANDANVQAVYRLYGQLYTEDHALQWAGMANLVGPLFYAGWQDLNVVRNVADGGDRLKYLTGMLGLPHLPGIVYDGADVLQDVTPLGGLSDLGSNELEWNEKKFLDMQKQIFDDMAWKHVAYTMGGIGLLREISRQGGLRPQELQPFEDIASGDPARVSSGNEALLRREQFDIIQNDYDEIRSHDGPVGATFTEALTWTAGNPIPGGHSYKADFHRDIDIDIPLMNPVPIGPQSVHVATIQVPEGNVADFEDRWRWISQDMLPHYRELLQHPDQMQALVDAPVADRAHQYRLVPLPYHP